jgi:BirA family biotin operon repressor/biotin-[acetyl-CoA-carboxylase] ligase
VVDPLTAPLVERRLRGAFGHPYVYTERMPSTQDAARGLPHGGVAVCEEQTAGRGRHGRTWACPYGLGVLFSLSLEPRRDAREIPTLSLVAAEAVCDALPVPALVRWPNDVVVNGRKIAGVLPEYRAPMLTLGIGINANLTEAELPDAGRLAPTSLLVETGASVDRGRLLADVLSALEARWLRWEQDGFRGLTRDELAGRRLRLADGTEGVAGGVDSDGRLLLEGRALASAEVGWVADA